MKTLSCPGGRTMVYSFQIGTTGKVDISSRKHTHQHTGCQYEYVGVLRDQGIEVHRLEHPSACRNGKEDIYQDKDYKHCIFL